MDEPMYGTSSVFDKNLKKLKKSGLWSIIESRIVQVLENPETGDKKWADLPDCYSVRIKNFRLVWTVKEGRVIFLACDSHDDAYDGAKKAIRDYWVERAAANPSADPPKDSG